MTANTVSCRERTTSWQWRSSRGRGICLMQMVLTQDPDLQRRKSPYLVVYSIIITGIGAFCVGVVLFEAILSRSPETTVNLCHLPSNATVH
ncbi:hypothetical protein AVEN_154017-1 [Araneus ventricosus]|nr:hypothetical protein AVEN_154017-1 [Araneus ventricosus]